jgi:CheY-like chemotaxis protein
MHTSARILVMDDKQEILELFRIILEEEGYEAIISETVIEDVLDIERMAPDAIILDLIMDRTQGGWNLLQAMKSYQPTASIPLVICTASATEIRAHEADICEYNIKVILKPFAVEEFLQAVAEILSASPSK